MPPTGNLWLAPAMAGVLLILLGVLIVIEPRILAMIVASVFIAGGLSMLAAAWAMRPRTLYRRLDEDEMPPGPDNL